MQLHVLGSAAGGGVPQWNCGCQNCTAAREQRLPARTQASLAASADGTAWVLFNVTTDIRAQLAGDPAFAPRSSRDDTLAAAFLTDANLDHAAGLLDLRQARALQTYSTPLVRDTLLANTVFAPFAGAPRHWHALADEPIQVAGLSIAPVGVPALLPSFAGGRRAGGAAAAYLISDRHGAAALYAPIFLEINPPLVAAANQADIAFFDGSFWTDDELISLGLGTRTAKEMGHAPIEGEGGSLDAVQASRCPRRFYTHINNSNPVLDPSSPASRRLREAGIEVASDGARFTLAAGATRIESRA